eukprot:549162-Amorphochlora_amoeboformis.AAC.1
MFRYDSRFVSVRSRFESVRSTRVWAQPVDVGNRQLPYASVIKKSLSSPKFEVGITREKLINYPRQPGPIIYHAEKRIH